VKLSNALTLHSRNTRRAQKAYPYGPILLCRLRRIVEVPDPSCEADDGCHGGC
jgi:hypothetical protein